MTMSYASVNTELSVRERTFLSQADLKQLLTASDDAHVALLLQTTPYRLEEHQLQQHRAIEATLMSALADEYAAVYQIVPDQSVVSILALKYVYHNLKVLLKMRAIQKDLRDLLIPIGPYDISTLEHLTLTLDSDVCDSIMVEEVRQTWREYEDYHNTVAIDMGMDSAYFRHLRTIAQQQSDEMLVHMVDGMIEWFNVITAKRAVAQQKPKSFMYQLMSRKGIHTPKQIREFVENNQLVNWFNQMNQLPYDLTFKPWVTKMAEGLITATDLEQMRDLYLAKLVGEAKLLANSPLSVLRYLLGKEFEVLNLRLILTGRANRLAVQEIEERMRLTYESI